MKLGVAFGGGAACSPGVTSAHLVKRPTSLLDACSLAPRIGQRWLRGYGRLYESTGSRNLEEAEGHLNRRLEQIRQASVYGVRPKRKWREAATRYLLEEAIDKDAGTDDIYRLKLLDPFLGERDLHQIHDGTLTSFIARSSDFSGSSPLICKAMETGAAQNLRESHGMLRNKNKEVATI
jgi:hypothetical protein